MGIDKNGYIRITGDMNQYNPSTTGDVLPYVDRYQKQTILYWKSNQQESIADGFAFAGGTNARTAIPGSGWSMGRFFKDNAGELYYSSTVHAIEGSNATGIMGIGLYKYNADDFTWSALGGAAPNTRIGTYNKVIFWDNSGFAPANWSQNYENRLHFAVACNTNTKYSGNDRLVYAVSDDGGLTWSKANGAYIPAFPLQGAAGTANMADVVVDVGPTGKFLPSDVGLAIDKNGTQAVFVGNICYLWNGSAWTTTNDQNNAIVPAPAYGYSTPSDDLILATPSTGKVAIADALDEDSYGYDFNTKYNNYICIDEAALRNTGVLYGIGYNTKNKVHSLLRTSLNPAPLPDGWKNMDISASAIPYHGLAGYNAGYFNITDYGSVIDDLSDSFHYVYKTLTGDGSITSRVNTTLASADGYSRAGVMMRATLTANSPHASVILAPGAKNKGALFTVRPSAGANGGSLASGGTVPTTYWTRLVRSGNTFTGFTSADGVTWKQIGQTTVSMPNTIYVGLAAASYAGLKLMQTAKFDQVVTTP